MLELDNEHISKEEVRNIQQELQVPSSTINEIMNTNRDTVRSVSPEPSLGTAQEVNDLKKRYRYKSEMSTLSTFMVRNFCVGLLIKYGTLFEQVEEAAHGVSLQELNNASSANGRMAQIQSRTIGQAELSKFVQVLMARVKATRKQFKQMCIMCIKFMSICDKASTNYMKYLKHDARKVITSTLFLTFADPKRESIIPLFSKATGLSDEQIRYCSDIVGPILKSEYLKQKRTLFRRTHANNSSSISNLNNSSNVDHSTTTQIDRDEPIPSTSHANETINNDTSESVASSPHGPTTAQPPSPIRSCRSFDVRSTNFGAFTDYYGNIDELDDSDSYLLPIELEQFNEMGKVLVHRNFRVI